MTESSLGGRAIRSSLALALVLLGLGCSPRRWDVEPLAYVLDAGMGGRAASTGGGWMRDGGPGSGGVGAVGGSGGSTDGGKDSCAPNIALARYSASVLLLVDRSSNTRDATDNEPAWWRPENDALNTILGTYGPIMTLGSLPFPNSNGCMVMDAVSVWETDLGAQLSSCTSASMCVSTSPEVPVIGAFSQALNYFSSRAPGPGPETSKRFVVVLVGSQPTCSSCSGNYGTLFLSLAKVGAQIYFVPFGGKLDGNACLSNLAFSSDGKLGNVAHGGPDLRANLVNSFKDIANESFCLFQFNPGFNYDAYDVVRAQMGGTVDVPKDPSHQNGWDFESGGLRLYGSYCDKIADSVTNRTFFSAALVDTNCKQH